MENENPLVLQCVEISERMSNIFESEEITETDSNVKVKTEYLLKLSRICRDLAIKVEELEKRT